MNLRDLQAKLPWAIPYSTPFKISQIDEGHRHLAHDVFHVQKSLGKIAAVCEKFDHVGQRPPRDPDPAARDALSREVADLVICALHIAKTNPFGEFDLEAAVLASLDRRNGSNLSEQAK